MSRKGMIAVFIFAIALLPTMAVAEEPSREETVNFIHDLVNGCPQMNYVSSADGDSWDVTIKISLNITGNLIILNAEIDGTLRQQREQGHQHDTWEAQANLSKLSPSVSIEHDKKYSTVTLSCSTGYCWSTEYSNFLEEENHMVNQGNGLSRAKHSYVYTCGKKSAEKIAKAFTHLITLQSGTDVED